MSITNAEYAEILSRNLPKDENKKAHSSGYIRAMSTPKYSRG